MTTPNTIIADLSHLTQKSAAPVRRPLDCRVMPAIEAESKMKIETAEGAIEAYTAQDAWEFADREAAWKWMFEQGRKAERNECYRLAMTASEPTKGGTFNDGKWAVADAIKMRSARRRIEIMEYEMNNGMFVEVDYFADQHDRKLIEIDSVTWRGVGIMHVLTREEMDELFSACYENELDLVVCAAEYRADAMRDGS